MKPILIDLPEFIETERLVIRPCMPGDGIDVHKSIKRSLEDLKPWMAFANKVQTVEEVEEGVRESYAKYILRQDLRLHIYLKETDEFIGSTGLHSIDWKVRVFEIGYWCDSLHTNQGYITESTIALIKLAKDSLKANRIEIRVDTRNKKSRAIPVKLGFTLDGVLKNESLSADGETLRDMCIYSLT
ncbi:GNAT family N-acetyltransferase [Bacillus sp. B1-b2]|uniref:GNAT family N-acetyltransferase n=1 Tax=Bacillus sp. B1-b2 TaxID=2653201 RepID=UPI0012626626|nr:GNAT family N-acetyltransferase [Bacillus sp. B1-b2]KAB7672870.1 GNAT family N-acetyltransferase [Bacillus sp. B1-b2]